MEVVPASGYIGKDKITLIYLKHACQFSYIILKTAERLIVRNISCGWPINERLSVELCDKIFTKFTLRRNSYGYFPSSIEYCYIPKIEGGHNYNWEVRAISDNEDLSFHAFKISAGISVKKQSCHFVRTILLRATKQAKKNYEAMMSIYKVVLENLKDGIELRQVYEAAMSFAEKEYPHLVKHLEKEFGFQLGRNFKVNSVAITSDSTVIAKEEMVFAININLINLKEDERYSLYYSDTVIVRKNEKPKVLTWYRPGHTILQPQSYEAFTYDGKYRDNTLEYGYTRPYFKSKWCRGVYGWNIIPCNEVTLSIIEQFAIRSGIRILEHLDNNYGLDSSRYGMYFIDK